MYAAVAASSAAASAGASSSNGLWSQADQSQTDGKKPPHLCDGFSVLQRTACRKRFPDSSFSPMRDTRHNALLIFLSSPEAFLCISSLQIDSALQICTRGLNEWGLEHRLSAIPSLLISLFWDPQQGSRKAGPLYRDASGDRIIPCFLRFQISRPDT